MKNSKKSSLITSTTLRFFAFVFSVGFSTNVNAAVDLKTDLDERELTLVQINLSAHPVPTKTRIQLARAENLVNGETTVRASDAATLLKSAVTEIENLPKLEAKCDGDTLKENIAYRGRSIVRGGRAGFYLRASNRVACEKLDVHELAISFKNEVMAEVTVDRRLVREAACRTYRADLKWRPWKQMMLTCLLTDGEGSFTAEID